MFALLVCIIINCCTLSENGLTALGAEVLACFRSSSALPTSHSRVSLNLPVELWSAVWLHLPFSSRVAVSQACRQWRKNALACQELWTDICLSIWADCAICEAKRRDERDILTHRIAPVRLEQLLQRSGQRYVSLAVIVHGTLDRIHGHVFKSVAEGLVSHAQRVHSLDIHASDNTCIPTFMRELPTLCNMKHLKASSLDQFNMGFLLAGALDAPRLEQVVIRDTLLSLASSDAVEAIRFPSLKALQCNVTSTEELVNAVRIATTGTLESLHLCLSNDTDEDIEPSSAEISLICSLLAEMPLLSIVMANLCEDDDQLMVALVQLKVDRITFQLVPSFQGFNASFAAVLNSLPTPTELLCSRVEGVDLGSATDTNRMTGQWCTCSVMDANQAMPVTGTAYRRDLHWDLDRLSQLSSLWAELPNNTYLSLKVLTIDSDLLHIFHGAQQTLTWPNVHTVTIQVFPKVLFPASLADAPLMLDLPALTTLKIEACLAQAILWMDIKHFRQSILSPILGDRTVKLMLFTGVMLHSEKVAVQLSELAKNAEIVRFE